MLRSAGPHGGRPWGTGREAGVGKHLIVALSKVGEKMYPKLHSNAKNKRHTWNMKGAITVTGWHKVGATEWWSSQRLRGYQLLFQNAIKDKQITALKAFSEVVFSLFTPSHTNGTPLPRARPDNTVCQPYDLCPGLCQITHCSEHMEVMPWMKSLSGRGRRPRSSAMWSTRSARSVTFAASNDKVLI